MLQPPTQVLNQWGTLDLSQIVNTSPNQYDPNPEKVTGIDIIPTTNPDRYSSGVICDHRFTAYI